MTTAYGPFPVLGLRRLRRKRNLWARARGREPHCGLYWRGGSAGRGRGLNAPALFG
jgi:hypothetical protein